MPNTLQILHLSDLHFGKPLKSDTQKLQLENVFSSLFHTIKEINSKEKIDFLVISGDIGFSGQKSDYAKNSSDINAQDFITQLKKSLGKETRVIICPGNHDKHHADFDKNKIDFVGAINNYNTDSALLRKMCRSKSKKDRGRIFSDYSKKYFKNYIDFCKKNRFALHENKLLGDNYLTGYQFFEDDGLAFLVLNSAWLSDPNNNDKGKLKVLKELAETLVFSVREKKPDMVIAVAHHSPYWLDWSERYAAPGKIPIINTIVSNSEIILVGHEHSTIFPPDDLNECCKLYVSGCVYDSPDKEDDYYFNSFQLLKICPSKSTILRTAYNYSPTPGTGLNWRKDDSVIESTYKSKVEERKRQFLKKIESVNFKSWNKSLLRTTLSSKNIVRENLINGFTHSYIEYLPNRGKNIILQARTILQDPKNKLHICSSVSYEKNILELEETFSEEILLNRVFFELF